MGKAQIGTLLKIVVGIILLAVGVWLIWFWRWEALILIKGCLGFVVVVAGLISLAIAKG